MRILCTLLFALTAYCTNAQTQNGVVKGTGPDGSPEEKTYRKGVLKGPYKSFYADQKLRIKGQYDNNLRTGQWKYYKYTDTNIPYVFQFNTYENDTLNGPFMLMTNDTITEGNYAGNLLNGPWKQYKLAIASSGDSMRSMIAVGEFREGVKAGHWKLYNEHGISKEGDYFLGQMSGQWKTYGAYTSPPKVMIESRYRKGKKDGREIQYFEYKSVPIPCKNPNARNCFDHKKVNIRREAIYNQGKLQGPYTVKGPDGKLLAKGEYIDGEKVGKWQEWNDEYRMMMYANYFDGRLAGPVTFQNEQGKTMISGSYNDNIKNSKWVWYRNDGTVEKEATYKNGKLNGDCTEYDTQGRRKVYKKFENDMLKKVVLYSNMGSVPAWEYNIEYPEQQGDPLSLEVKHLRGDTTEYTNYLYRAEYPIDHNSFVADFDKAKNTGKAYRDGTYEKYANDVLLYSGNYTEGKKDGVWEYDLTKGVRWQKTFEAGKLVKEYFINIQGKTPFEGDYILKYRGGGMRCLFKIKEGYRNGKSRYYDRKGIEVRTEKYKEGQLQK